MIGGSSSIPWINKPVFSSESAGQESKVNNVAPTSSLKTPSSEPVPSKQRLEELYGKEISEPYFSEVLCACGVHWL